MNLVMIESTLTEMEMVTSMDIEIGTEEEEIIEMEDIGAVVMIDMIIITEAGVMMEASEGVIMIGMMILIIEILVVE